MSFNFTFSHTRREFIVAVVCAVAAAGGLWGWTRSVAREQELVPVVVAARDVAAPRKLTAEDVMVRQLPRSIAPQKSLIMVDQAIGKVLLRPLLSQEIITTIALSSDRDPLSEATLVPVNKVGFLIPSTWLATFIPRVKKNDFIRLYGALITSRGQYVAANIIARAIPVLGVVADKDGLPSAILVGANDAEVARALDAHTQGYQMVVAVESANF